jgi:hypothetical protein
MLKDFENLLNQVQNRVKTIRAMIQTNDKLREIIYGDKLKQELQTQKELQELKKNVPDSTKWRIYDHCAVVTQLYSIYESFVEDLIKSWIGELSEIYPNYLDLDKKIRKTHQIGVAQILLKPQKVKRFGNLSVEQIIRGLYLGESASSAKYELLPEAFLLHEQNLWKDILDNFFAKAGIPDAWKWIENYRKIQNFEKTFLTDPDTTESKLYELISYRNEASHGYDINPVLNTQQLINLCDFIEPLCQAIIELVNYHIIESKINQNQAQKIGKIIEWFPKRQAYVAKILETVSETILSTGDSVVLISKTKSYCQLAKIENIQIDNEDKKEVTITPKIELGIKFNVEAQKDLEIVVVK